MKKIHLITLAHMLRVDLYKTHKLPTYPKLITSIPLKFIETSKEIYRIALDLISYDYVEERSDGHLYVTKLGIDKFRYYFNLINISF